MGATILAPLNSFEEGSLNLMKGKKVLVVAGKDIGAPNSATHTSLKDAL
jgi:hypothetical protein